MTSRPSRRSVAKGLMAASAAMSLASRSGSTAQPRVHLIEITGLEFQPSKLAVKEGDTVTWLNHDIAPHTATAQDGSWDTGQIDKGQRKSIVIGHDVGQSYYCRFHPAMKAGIVIK